LDGAAHAYRRWLHELVLGSKRNAIWRNVAAKEIIPLCVGRLNTSFQYGDTSEDIIEPIDILDSFFEGYDHFKRILTK
jgi:hypothetical protein